MKNGILENDKLYLEYNSNIGGSIFKFQAKNYQNIYYNFNTIKSKIFNRSKFCHKR